MEIQVIKKDKSIKIMIKTNSQSEEETASA